MIEIIGTIITVIAVIGVWQNNCRRRVCFILWIVSNTMSAGLHFYYGSVSLIVRDLIFLGFAFHGFYRWRNADEKIKGVFADLEMIAKNRNRSKKRNRHLSKNNR